VNESSDDQLGGRNMFNTKTIRRKFRGKREFVILFLATLCLLLNDHCIFAEIIDCPGTPTPNVYQVYLDDFEYTSDAIASDEEFRDLMKRLDHQMTCVLEGVLLESVPLDVDITSRLESRWEIHYCKGRKPQNQSEFTADFMEQLYLQGVILEIWGLLDTRTGESETSQHEAIVNYVLFPVWMNSDSASKNRLGFQSARYISDPSSPQHLDLLKDTPELRIFVATCLGVKLLAKNDYDGARGCICYAKLQLEECLEELSPGSLEYDRKKSLLNFVDEMALRTIRDAQQDIEYDGALKLIIENEECPCHKEGEGP
jgi:hypothetical protein